MVNLYRLSSTCRISMICYSLFLVWFVIHGKFKNISNFPCFHGKSITEQFGLDHEWFCQGGVLSPTHILPCMSSSIGWVSAGATRVLAVRESLVEKPPLCCRAVGCTLDNPFLSYYIAALKDFSDMLDISKTWHKYCWTCLNRVKRDRKSGNTMIHSL